MTLSFMILLYKIKYKHYVRVKLMKNEKPYRKKGEKTKQKLFVSAAELFNQYDFNEVTVDSIVEAAGVAKGTFYIYFESKDALIAAFISDYVSKVDTDYRAFLETYPPDMTATKMLMGDRKSTRLNSSHL